jgi:hypothetical protein
MGGNEGRREDHGKAFLGGPKINREEREGREEKNGAEIVHFIIR